jgi:hypothetical protein
MDTAVVQLDHTLTDNDFYSVIPVASQYWSSGTVAPDDAHARFVGVQLRAQSLSTIFPVSFLGGAGNGYTAGASAVAGMDMVSCKPVPMFICNPFVGTPTAGRMIRLQFPDNNQWGPGNFGWLDTNAQGVDYAGAPNACGAGNMVTQGVAQSVAPACGRISNLVTETGNIANADDGINTRFDLYNASFGSCKTNALYAPATNVRAGYKPGANACNPVAPQPGAAGRELNMGLPFDNNMLVNGLPNPDPDPSNGLGNGQWACGNIDGTNTNNVGSLTPNNANSNFTLTVSDTAGISQGMPVVDMTNPANPIVFGYAATPNQNGNPPPVVTPTTVLVTPTQFGYAIPSSIRFDGYWSTNFGAAAPPPNCNNGLNLAQPTASRDSVYQYEITNNLVNTASMGGETGGTPFCSTQTPNADRRYIDVAVVDCPTPLNGKQFGLHAAAIWKFFLTVPVASNQGPIFGEYHSTEPPPGAGNPNFFYEVQLYR